MPSKKTFLPFLILTVGLMLCLQASQSAFAQQLELVVQTGHSDAVLSVAFSPDGKTSLREVGTIQSSYGMSKQVNKLNLLLGISAQTHEKYQ